MLAVAFSSRPGTGKTAVATALAERHGLYQASVGEVLRNTLTALGYNQYMFTDPALKDLPSADMHGRTPRQMMLDLGAWGRAIHPEFWLRRVVARVPADARGVVFEDLMDDFEAAFVRSWLGAPVVRLVRWAAVEREDGRTPVHPDFIVANNGELGTVVDDVMDRVEIWSLRPVAPAPCAVGIPVPQSIIDLDRARKAMQHQ